MCVLLLGRRKHRLLLLLLLLNEVLILSLYYCRLNHGLLMLLLLLELNLRRYRLFFSLTSALVTLDGTLFLFSILQSSLLEVLLKFIFHCFCHLDVYVLRCIHHFLDSVNSFLGFSEIFLGFLFRQGLIVDVCQVKRRTLSPVFAA